VPDLSGGIDLSTTADLDTASPISDRPAGTLVSAVDVSARWWGPRKGSLAFTRVWEGPGTAALYDEITLLGTNSAHGRATSNNDSYRDLGTQWTLDIWFRLNETAYAAADDVIGLYEFLSGGGHYVSVAIGGGNAADASKVKVSIQTTSARATFTTAVTFTSTNTISAGTAQTDKHHLRIVRDGADATLYVDGIEDGSTSSLAAAEPHQDTYKRSIIAKIGFSTSAFGGADASLKGIVYAVVLRDGAFNSEPIENRMPCAPWARNVHHYILGRSYGLGSEIHMFDAGPYAVHPRMIGGEAVDYTISSANDDAAPVPSPMQAVTTWTTRANRTVTSAMCGGILSTAVQS